MELIEHYEIVNCSIDILWYFKLTKYDSLLKSHLKIEDNVYLSEFENILNKHLCLHFVN